MARRRYETWGAWALVLTLEDCDARPLITYLLTKVPLRAAIEAKSTSLLFLRSCLPELNWIENASPNCGPCCAKTATRTADDLSAASPPLATMLTERSPL